VTLKVRTDVPSLRTVRLVREIERSFSIACDRDDFRLTHYSLQGNHAHLIVEADDERALGRGMKAIGSRLARAVNRIFGRSGPVLADRYHVHVVAFHWMEEARLAGPRRDSGRMSHHRAFAGSAAPRPSATAAKRKN